MLFTWTFLCSCIWITHIRRRFNGKKTKERTKKKKHTEHKMMMRECMVHNRMCVYVSGSTYFRTVHSFDITKHSHGPIYERAEFYALCFCKLEIHPIHLAPCASHTLFVSVAPFHRFGFVCMCVSFFLLRPCIYLYTLEYEFLVIRMLWNM